MTTNEVYITISNFKKIVYGMSDIKNLNLQGAVYKKDIYSFSRYEKNGLLAIKELLKDPENYFDKIYKPLEVKSDTYQWVNEYEGQSPAYHKTKDCIRLKSDYTNFKIPDKIQERGRDAVIEFRKWFKEEGLSLLEKGTDIFEMRLQIKYEINAEIETVRETNKGIISFNNYTIEELENTIDEKLREAGRYYNESEKNKTIISKYSTRTFLANPQYSIEDNDTKYSEEEIRTFLLDYDKRFKKPLKEWLIDYYRLKFNPDIKMQGKLLDALNFKPCRCFLTPDDEVLRIMNELLSKTE